ncbi:MAG: CHASE2 domain-containing protein [Chloroflexota bacterium]
MIGTRRQRRVLRHAAIVFGVSALFGLLFFAFRPFASANWRLTDQLFLPGEVSPNVVVVSVDDETLAQYGKWSEWPRSLHAMAIQNLSSAEAMVIGMDILFCDSSAEDRLLAEAIDKAGNVVLPVAGNIAVATETGGQVYEGFLLPTRELRDGVVLGHANLMPDGDGVVRRLGLFATDRDGRSYPSFALAVLSVLGAQEPPTEGDQSGGFVRFLGRDIPVDEGGRMRINFSGTPGVYQRLSYGSVLQGDFDPEEVKHKVVLIGMTATAEPDFWPTPLSPPQMAGVEVHANAIDCILTERFLRDESGEANLATCLVLAGLAAAALPALRLRWGALLMVALLAGYLAWASYQLDHGYVANVLYPVAILPIGYISSLVCRTIDEQRDKRNMERVFGRYVSPEVASEIMRLDDRGQLVLGGQEREVTVLFCDARGYTALSQRESAETVVSLINTYFSAMIPCILNKRGMINKFAGDNIMVVWGVPQDQADHALLSVKAAMEVQGAVRRVQEGKTELPKVEFGIGINTGVVVAGNVGSMGRTEYTVIGDAVNLAARICGAAPGGSVWLGPKTYEQVKDRVEVRGLDPQKFKGAEKAMAVYEVLGVRE